MENFNKQNLSAMRAELNAVLTKYGIENNIDITIGNMSFTSTEVSMKVTAKISGATSRKEQQSDLMLNLQMKMNGLKKINSAGDELLEYNIKAHKMPFIFRKKADGKRYKISHDAVRVLFAA